MRRHSAVTRALLAALILCLPAAASGGTAPWSEHSAYTLPAGRLEASVFQTWRYGLTDRVELGTHPVLSLVAPQAYAKFAIRQTGMWDFSSRHRLLYPTPLLRLLSREGTGGLLPSRSRIPGIVSLNNEVLATHMTHNGHLFTAHLGLRTALIFGDSQMATIDLPVIFPRTAAYQGRTVLTTGANLVLRPAGSVELLMDLQVFIMTPGDEQVALEHDLLLRWEISSRVLLTGGYKVVWGEYPLGNQLSILPIIDLSWVNF